MAQPQRVIRVQTPEGRSIALPVVVLGAEQQVAAEAPPQLAGALAAVEEFAADFKRAVLKVAPTKATVEFGITFALQAGKLTALFVDGKAEGAVTVTLEWDRSDAAAAIAPDQVAADQVAADGAAGDGAAADGAAGAYAS